MKHFNLSLGAHESLLVIVFLVTTEDWISGLGGLERLSLQVLVVSVVETGGRYIKLRSIPLLERADQLLLDGVDLALTLRELCLEVFELGEVVPIDLLQVLHFAEHHKLLLVNDLLGLLGEHVILTQLFILHAHLSFLFLAVKSSLQGINLSLVLVESVRDSLDLSSSLLDRVAMVPDAAFESLARIARLKLDEGLLLIDGFALLLDGFFEFSFFISFPFGAFLLAFGFTFDLNCWILRFFGFLL